MQLVNIEIKEGTWI